MDHVRELLGTYRPLKEVIENISTTERIRNN